MEYDLELTARMESILEALRYTPILDTCTQYPIEDIYEAAILKIACLHSLLPDDARVEREVVFWCRLLGYAFGEAAGKRQGNPLQVKTIYLGNVTRFDYASCIEWAIQKIAHEVNSIMNHEMML